MSPAKGLLTELYRVNIDSGKSDLLLSGASEAALSPDRQRWVASTSSVLLIANADGGDQHPLNVEGSSPSWSPDGQWILYYPQLRSGSAINRIRPDGSEMRENAAVSPALPPIWSPDGQSFLVQAGDPGTKASSWLSQTSLQDGRTQLISMPVLKDVQNWNLLGWAP
jgi:dipeptidyl aminopeptidase/acylaminoacyl peptidase